MSPLCESFLTAEQLNQMEPFYPLRVHVCPALLPGAAGRIRQPVGTSSASTPTSRRISSSWVEHARAYTETMRQRFDLTEKSFVIEIASNDGYLLQHFVQAGIPVLGIEPAANVAEVARPEARADALRASSAPTPHGSWRPRASRPICCSATTCWRTCPI